MKSCYHKCINKLFGFARMDSMTQILIMFRLPSFDTVLHNAKSSFHKQCHNTSNCLIHYFIRLFDVSMWCLATKWMDGWLHFSVFILVFLSIFLHGCVCVCVCVLLCLYVRLSWSAIHVTFVGLDVSYCSWVSSYFLSVFLCGFCLCAIFFYGPCCLNKINDDYDAAAADDDDDDSPCTEVLKAVTTGLALFWNLWKPGNVREFSWSPEKVRKRSRNLCSHGN